MDEKTTDVHEPEETQFPRQDVIDRQLERTITTLKLDPLKVHTGVRAGIQARYGIAAPNGG
jgi:hypothetical protein